VRLGRILLATLMGTASLIAAYRVAWREYRCNLALARVKSIMEHRDVRSDFVTALVARDNQALLDEDCARCRTQRVEFLLLKGTNEVLVHQYGSAIGTYRGALEFDRRPEIYLDIGLTELDRGSYQEALRNLISACEFNFAMSAEIPEPARSEVATRVNNARTQVIESLERKRQ
jgi:hypothetical protein